MPEILGRLNRALENRYRVERELGRGGMATVFLADDLRHDRKVAIKVLQPEIALAVGVERFLKEIRVAAQLNHPHILPLLDSGDADGVVYYVMPFVDGGTLRDRLSRERQLGIEDALAVTKDVADALAFAHSKGVLHRDVKPENILLAPGHAIVTDFGIARAIQSAGSDRLTSTGVAVGTPTYMSVEQALAERELDGRSDMYSLACVTYEMLVGEPPFTGPTAQVMLARRLNEMPRSIRATRSAVTPAVDAAVSRALSPMAADRFATMQEFVDALSKDTTSHEPLTVLPTRTIDAAQAGANVRRRWMLIVGLSVLIVAAVLLLLQQQRIPAGSSSPAGPPRLAVLPLENLGQPTDEPFAAGISEEITGRLAEIGALRVVSRTSAKRFTTETTSISELGKALNADYIVEGTVRTDYDERGVGVARVSVQLIRVADDVHVWQRRFDAPLIPGEIFRVQADIASQIAAALNVTLLEPERARLARIATNDSTAYRLYQLGRFHWEKRDAAGLLRASDYFRQAIALDTAFAEAYAGLADATNAYVLLFESGNDNGERAAAIAAARRAIALDSTLAAAHAALGFALTFFEWKWMEADAAFARAITLDPDYGPARYWYAQLLWLRDKPAEALEQSRHAIAVDPLSAVAQLAYARSLRLMNRTEEWAAALTRVTELQPNLWVPYIDLAEYHATKRQDLRTREAVQQFVSTAFPGHVVDTTTVRMLTGIMYGAGNASTTIRSLELAGISLQPGVAARWFALTGESDSAFARMHRAIDLRSPDVATALPFLESLLGNDPRWSQLRRRIGVEQ
jgi:eukaryotic-like serine/threonine-protein kinase